MKKILSCLLTSVLFLSLIPGSLAQSAPLMAPQGEAQGYLAKKEGMIAKNGHKDFKFSLSERRSRRFVTGYLETEI